jgi:hypothetical protein
MKQISCPENKKRPPDQNTGGRSAPEEMNAYLRMYKTQSPLAGEV